LAGGSVNARSRRPLIVGAVIVGMIAVLAVIASVSAGGDGDDDGLADSSWVVTDMQGAELADGTDATVSFAATTLSANGGCNTANGGYTTSEDTIAVSPLASTLIACEPPINDMESAFFARLQTAETFEIDGDTLTMDGSDGPLVLTRG
jgi:heat shock protein HslJ